jgi:inner membrane transporter RhtA
MYAASARPAETARRAPSPPTTAKPGGTRPAGVVTMVASGLSNQTGAAIGSLAFPVLGPVGVVAVRQYVAAVVLLAVGRPRLRTFTWSQWWPVVLLALVFGAMNLSLHGPDGPLSHGPLQKNVSAKTPDHATPSAAQK